MTDRISGVRVMQSGFIPGDGNRRLTTCGVYVDGQLVRGGFTERGAAEWEAQVWLDMAAK